VREAHEQVQWTCESDERPERKRRAEAEPALVRGTAGGRGWRGAEGRSEL